MAFTMRGLPQYGDEGPKQLSNFARRIFGNKEQREREKRYFQAKKEIRKGLKGKGSVLIKDGQVIAGGVPGIDDLEAGKKVRNLYSGGRKYMKDAASKIADGGYMSTTTTNDKGETVTTSEERAIVVGDKKRRLLGKNKAYAYANAKEPKNAGLNVDVDFDVNTGANTRVYKPAKSQTTKNVTTTTPERTEIIPGEKKTETFDNLEDAEKRNQELLSTPGILKIKKAEEEGVDMKSGLGFNMRSNIYELSGAKAKVMQASNNENPNPITSSTEEHTLDFGGGSTVSRSQEDYNTKPTELKGPKTPEAKKNFRDKCLNADGSRKPEGTIVGNTKCSWGGGGKNIPGMSDSKTNITLEYKTPDKTNVIPSSTKTTSTSVSDDATKVKDRGLQIDVDADLDVKGKLPKLGIGKAIKTGIDKITGNTEKGRERRAKRDKIKKIRKGGDVCPPCPPCN